MQRREYVNTSSRWAYGGWWDEGTGKRKRAVTKGWAERTQYWLCEHCRRRRQECRNMLLTWGTWSRAWAGIVLDTNCNY